MFNNNNNKNLILETAHTTKVLMLFKIKNYKKYICMHVYVIYVCVCIYTLIKYNQSFIKMFEQKGL